LDDKCNIYNGVNDTKERVQLNVLICLD